MNRQKRIFQEYTVWHSIAAMALPAMVSMVVMILYNITDMFFVGMLNDTAQIAAVSVVGTVFSFIMAIGSMLGSGGCAIIARTLGAQDDGKVKQYSSVCCWGSLAIGLVFTGVILLFQQPLLAYHYGAKNLPRLRETLLKLATLTVLTGGALTLICLFNSGTVVGLFLQEAEALALGQQMVRLLVIAGPFLGMFYIGSNFLQASGNAPLATFTSLLRQGLFLIPLLYIMNHFFGVTGNIWAHVVADISSAIVSVALTLRQYHRLSHTLSENKSNVL